jgi:hypothetical protein
MNTLKGATMTIADAVRRGSSWLIRPFMDQDLLTNSSRRGSTTANSSIASGGGGGSTTANSSIASGGGGGGSTTANSSIASGGGGGQVDINIEVINRSARDLDQQIRYYGWNQVYDAMMSGQNLPPPPPPPPPV